MIKNADAKLKAAFVLGAILSWPVVRQLLDGTMSSTDAAVRIALALALAYGGVLLVVSVVTGYLPEPEPEPEAEAPELEGVEDAVLVDDLALEAHEETTEDA